jgi:hypothetical protein
VDARETRRTALTSRCAIGATATAAGAEQAPKPTRRSSEKTVTQLHEQAPEDLRNLYGALESYLLSLGDDVTKTTRQLYYAFRRIKNFACVEIHPQTKKLLVYLKADPTAITVEPGSDLRQSVNRRPSGLRFS